MTRNDQEQSGAFWASGKIWKTALVIIAILIMFSLVETTKTMREQIKVLSQQLLSTKTDGYLQGDDLPRALTIIGHLLDDTADTHHIYLQDFLSYRISHLEPLQAIVKAMPSPMVLNWGGNDYWHYKGKLFFLGDRGIDQWWFSPHRGRLLTIAQSGTENRIVSYRWDGEKLHEQGEVSEFSGITITRLIPTAEPDIFLAELHITVHHARGAYLEQFSLARLNMQNGSVDYIWPDDLGTDWEISSDRRYLRSSVSPVGSRIEKENVFDLKKYASQRQWSPPRILPESEKVISAWHQQDNMAVEFTASRPLEFPLAKPELEYQQWTWQRCELGKVGWKEIPSRPQESEGNTSLFDDTPYGSRALQHDLPLTLYKDPGGTCGRHYLFAFQVDPTFKARDAYNRLTKAMECVKGYGPARLTADGRYMAILDSPFSSLYSFIIVDLQNNLILTPNDWLLPLLHPDYVAFSQSNGVHIAMLSERNEVLQYRILDHQECSQKESDGYYGDNSGACLELENRFIVDGKSHDGNRTNQDWQSPAKKKLYLLSDSILILQPRQITAVDRESGHLIWRTMCSISGEIADSSLSPDEQALIITDGKQVDILSTGNGLSLSGLLDMDTLLNSSPSDNDLCKSISKAFSKENLQIPPFEGPSESLAFWLADGRPAIRANNVIMVRNRANMEKTVQAKLTSCTGFEMKAGEVCRVPKLPETGEDTTTTAMEKQEQTTRRRP